MYLKQCIQFAIQWLKNRFSKLVLDCLPQTVLSKETYHFWYFSILWKKNKLLTINVFHNKIF